MIIGFSSHGQGSAAKPIDYLTAETVSAGVMGYLTGPASKRGVRREPAPAIVKGDAVRSRALIDQVSFKHKYSSGVLSFAPGETITPEMESYIIGEFEKTAFAGLDAGDYDCLWVRHQHTSGGRHELHFITPRQNLRTGRSLNIAPPRNSTRKLFDTLRSKLNAQFGLADPDDPARARTHKLPAHVAKGRAREAEATRKQPPAAVLKPASVDRLAEVEKKLAGFVQARAEYNKERYGKPPCDQPHAEHPFATYDRTGTTSYRSTEATRTSLPGTGSGVCSRAHQFEHAVGAWDAACGGLAEAGLRFERATREIASPLDQAVTAAEQRQEAAAIMSKYGIVARRTTTPDRERGFEPEMQRGGDCV